MTRAFTLLAAAVAFSTAALAQPIRLHPDNPHYFLYRGQPTVLVTSGEHYGSVLNPDFNYVRYLDTLQKDGLNQTRLFLGTYFEKPGDFGIRDNTLGPTAAKVLTPWARSPQAGSVWGGAKYDLDRWDEAFFTRLKDFMTQAQSRGVVVELTFFSDYYGTKQSPLFAENNINGVGAVASEAMNTESNGGALAHQERLVRRVVRDLNDFDNLIYEIQNEPWVAGGVTTRILQTSITEDQLKDPINMWKNRVSIASPASLAWQRQVSGWVADEETRLAKKHLVSQNIANFVHPVGDPDPRVSVFAFHYAWPDAVRLNYGLNRVVSQNETGFAGREDATYRRQAWRFLLAGGGAFNHLDYSFTVGHEDGTGVNEAPGGGSVALRRQFGVLRTFLQAAPLAALGPDYATVVQAGDAYVQALSTADRRTVLLYIEGSGAVVLNLELAAGRYAVEWTDPASGRATAAPVLNHAGGALKIVTPAITEDLALRLQRQ
jgi:hypothetical protein